MSLIINNLVWTKLEEVENIFWSKDFDLIEKVKNWIFEMFWENEVSRNFSNCLDEIVNWNKLTNEENSWMLYQNPSLEYIFDFWKIWKNLSKAWEEIDFWKNSEKINKSKLFSKQVFRLFTKIWIFLSSIFSKW